MDVAKLDSKAAAEEESNKKIRFKAPRLPHKIIELLVFKIFSIINELNQWVCQGSTDSEETRLAIIEKVRKRMKITQTRLH